MSRIGDIYADRDLFAKAAPYWDRIPQAAPGQSGGYLEAASIYWDYFDFDNALRLLNQGRKKLADENLYSYEAGAIYEDQRDYARAIGEYVKGSLAERSEFARRCEADAVGPQAKAPRPDRPANREAGDRAQPCHGCVILRVRVLEAQDRKPEMESFLDSIANSTASIEEAEDVEALATQKSLERVRQHARKSKRHSPPTQ